MKITFESGKSLSEFSTFGIGGLAHFFVAVNTIEEMQSAISECRQKKLSYFILGKGSNCLFDDRGFDGVVILNKIGHCYFDGPVVEVGAGYSFSLLGVQTARKGYAGLEFASGIPGSVGGAIFMNAGANGGETKEYLSEVQFVDEDGQLHQIPKEKLEFRYRFSSFQEMKGAIVGGKFQLILSQDARKKQLEIVDYRMRTQPYKAPSAGCVFRNPSAGSAGALIEQCGLKGMQIGGATVSPMHANFIVNSGGATANDVLQLAALIKKVILEKKGIHLEMEVKYIPYK